jgi:hypothetical protein
LKIFKGVKETNGNVCGHGLILWILRFRFIR